MKRGMMPVRDQHVSIGKLKRLRYLDISMNGEIKELPKSIVKLYNLQTLRLLQCWNLIKLPINIRNLVSLRHIYFSDQMPIKVGCLTGLRTLPLFVVGLDEGYKIHELKGLIELRGELEICNLELVKDGEEASRADLKKKKKKNLSELRLTWHSRQEDIISSSNCNDEDVLEGLLPPPSIQSLTVYYYMGKQIPKWMSMEISDSSCQLVELSLRNCHECEIIPTLGHLPHLKILEIFSMHNIKCIGSEFYGESNGKVSIFPVLKKLSLRFMPSLVEWATPAIAEGCKQSTLVFPSLQELVISYCACLTSIPLGHLSSLVTLKISGCRDMPFLSNEFHKLTLLQDLDINWCAELVSISRLQDLVSLKRMDISDCPKVTSLPLDLTSLESLTIDDFDNLSSDAFRGLSALEYLRISKGHSLELMPSVEGLTSLKTLKISICAKLTSLPMGLHLLPSLREFYIHISQELSDLSSNVFSTITCLEELEISSCPKVTSLPRWVKFCNSLTELTVEDCGGMTSIDDDITSSLTQLKTLNLGYFSEELEDFPGLSSIHRLSNLSLENMNLYGWSKLKSLPHQLQYLTALKKLYIRDFYEVEALPWLRHLSSLQELTIWNCPLLAERCAKDSGPEWPNISHIPHIRIDDEVIQNLGS